MTEQAWLASIPSADRFEVDDALDAIHALVGDIPQPPASEVTPLAAAIHGLTHLASVYETCPEFENDTQASQARRGIIAAGRRFFDAARNASLTLRRAATGVIGGVGADPLVWTPSAVKGELRRILGIIDLVNQEVSAAAKAGQVTGDEWNQWRTGVYLPAHEFLVKASDLWGSNAVTAQEWEQKAKAWRDFVASRGGRMMAPGNVFRTPPTEWTTPLLLGAVVVVLALGLGFAGGRRR